MPTQDNDFLKSQHKSDQLHEFGAFTLDDRRGVLLLADKEVKLRPKSFKLLTYMVHNPGRLLSKDELMNAVWQQVVVSEDSLTHCLIDVRKALGDVSKQMIRTVPRRGYIFDLKVSSYKDVGDMGAQKLDIDTTQKSSFKFTRPIGVALLVMVIAAMFGWQQMRSQQSIPQQLNTSDTNNVLSTIQNEVQAIPSIAVLPFEDFSQDKGQEYFAKGISEELLNVLARTKGLRVVSRTSAFSFEDSNAKITEIAETLNVRHILEGSIRKSGDTLRITAQLIDTSTDEHLWSGTYDRALTAENLFDMQDEISEAIVIELKGWLSTDVTETSTRTTSLEAYELYLHALENFNLAVPLTLQAAVDGLTQVIALDSNYAPAYAALADSYLVMSEYDGMERAEAIELARPYLDRAFELAPNSAEALTTAALTALWENDFKSALELSTQAIDANPNYVLGYHRQGMVYLTLAQNEKALASFEKGLALDPLSTALLGNAGIAHLSLGNLEAARLMHEKNIRFNPTRSFGYTHLANIKSFEFDYAGAHSLLKDAQAINHELPEVKIGLGTIYAGVGLFDQLLVLDNTSNSKVWVHFANGQLEIARKLADENSSIHFNSGDTKRAYPYYRTMATRYNLLSRPITTDSIEFMARTAITFKAESDPDAQLLIDRLTYYYKDKSPAGISDENILIAGGLLYVITGETNKVNSWMARLAELGYADVSMKQYDFPGLQEMRQNPEWLQIEKRIIDNSISHREAIQVQLANPKPNWVKDN